MYIGYEYWISPSIDIFTLIHKGNEINSAVKSFRVEVNDRIYLCKVYIRHESWLKSDRLLFSFAEWLRDYVWTLRCRFLLWPKILPIHASLEGIILENGTKLARRRRINTISIQPFILIIIVIVKTTNDCHVRRMFSRGSIESFPNQEQLSNR